MHEAIAGCLRAEPDMQVRTAWLDQPQHGLGGAMCSLPYLI